MNKIKVTKGTSLDSGKKLTKLNTQNFWQTFVDVYNEFAAETSIHGLKYTTQRKLKIDGFIWLTIVSISIVCAGLLASRFYERHRAASMRTTVVSTQYPSWDLKLPAVTLCHGTLALRHKLRNLFNERGILIPRGMTYENFEESVGYLREAIEPTNRFVVHTRRIEEFMKSNLMSMQQFIEKVSPNCSEYLIECRRNGKEEPCLNIMSESLAPYGLCCSFNYHFATRDHKYVKTLKSDDYHSVTYGSRFSLSFLMNPLLEGRLSSIFYGDGIKVLIHESLSYPGSASIEFVAPSNSETIASIHGNRLTSSLEVLNLGEDVRSCVNSDKQVPPYRASNCYAECRERELRTGCRCQPFYAFSESKDAPYCDFDHIECLARNTVGANSLKLEDPKCRCSPECSENTYSVTTTTIPLNAPEFSPSPIYKDTSRCPNATILHITVASQMMTLQRRDVVQSWINLLSSLGGVFSLFLGCSFISLIEILYFFFILLPSKLYSNRKIENNSQLKKKIVNMNLSKH